MSSLSHTFCLYKYFYIDNLSKLINRYTTQISYFVLSVKKLPIANWNLWDWLSYDLVSKLENFWVKLGEDW